MNQFDIKEIFINNINDNTTLNLALALVEEWADYKSVLDKIKEYVNDVIIDETYTNYINELLEEIYE